MGELLLELLSEEIPAGLQARAVADLQKRVCDALVEQGLTYSGAAGFSTPRRLCLTICDLPSASPDIREERKGPRVDAPEKAIAGFLRSQGLTKNQLEEREDKKGRFYFAVIDKPGRSAAAILADVIPGVIADFPWPKSMRWGSGAQKWVRPLHSILCILSDDTGCEVVPYTALNVQSGDQTQGHRFMAPASFSVTSFEDYEARLHQAKVVVRPEARADAIAHKAGQLAFAQGLELVDDKALLAEVAGLVEWPVVLLGDIAPDFLDLPPEVLQTSMREHQKFFSLRSPKTGRIEKFITVANRETRDQGTTILAGNQKVLFARLSDAKFFWENDLRAIRDGGLAAMGKPLENVTFHNKLGSQAERVARIVVLARDIAIQVGADENLAIQAATVAKADLCSEMVGEFPELQGLMGRYYAKAAGLDPAVAAACQEHYAPLGPSDDAPDAPVSMAVALADKIDTLTGFWTIDEKPTGSKDPFALRRAALGVIRLVLENELRLNLAHVIPNAEVSNDLLSFFHDRLKVYLRDKGISHDVIDACLAMPDTDDFTLLLRRAEALQAFLKTDDGSNLLKGFKRANNILSAEENKDGVEYSLEPDQKFAEEEAEKALFTALDHVEKTLAPVLEGEDFAAAMKALAGLRQPIDRFFTDVQVNADNQILRRNRLCLLNHIRQVMGSVAYFPAIDG